MLKRHRDENLDSYIFGELLGKTYTRPEFLIFWCRECEEILSGLREMVMMNCWESGVDVTMNLHVLFLKIFKLSKTLHDVRNGQTRGS